MFSDQLALQIADAAKAAGISETGMLALVEVETNGTATEEDGRTPNFLFERHVFHRELAARQKEKLAKAKKAGLAIPKWDPSTQYKDEKTSGERLALLAQARAIDADCANRACSWGLPQLMGNECREVGFPTAGEMVDHLTKGGVPAHLDLMIRFLKARNLEGAIAAKQWSAVALHYNGSGYEKNHYDTRLEAADRKWQRRLPLLRAAGSPVTYPEEALSSQEIEQIQILLRQLGYTELGDVDGRWGDKTSAAIFAFQRHEGLPPTGHYDEPTRLALKDARPRPIPEERQNTTLDDLRNQGSRTVKNADAAETIGKGKVILGGVAGSGAILDKLGHAIDDANDQIDQVQSIAGSIKHLLHSLLDNWWLIAVAGGVMVAGFVVIHYARKVKAARLLDHQTGIHAGKVGG